MDADEAAAAAEVSVRLRAQVGRALPRRGRARPARSLLGAGRVANRTPEDRVEAIAALRRLRFTGPEIAELFGMALSTVSGILTRIGMGKLGRLGLEPARRYERERPGELIHVDVKKLGRIEGGAGNASAAARQPLQPHVHRPRRQAPQTVGWEFVHIAIDDCTRLAYAEVLADEKATTAVGFLRRALAFFKRHGIRVERLLTDNGSAYRSTDPRDRLPRARHPPPAHPPLPAADQRQSRALHPHPARRLGLRRDLPHQPRAHRSP